MYAVTDALGPFYTVGDATQPITATQLVSEVELSIEPLPNLPPVGRSLMTSTASAVPTATGLELTLEKTEVRDSTLSQLPGLGFVSDLAFPTKNAFDALSNALQLTPDASTVQLLATYVSDGVRVTRTEGGYLFVHERACNCASCAHGCARGRTTGASHLSRLDASHAPPPVAADASGGPPRRLLMFMRVRRRVGSPARGPGRGVAVPCTANGGGRSGHTRSAATALGGLRGRRVGRLDVHLLLGVLRVGRKLRVMERLRRLSRALSQCRPHACRRWSRVGVRSDRTRGTLVSNSLGN